MLGLLLAGAKETAPSKSNPVPCHCGGALSPIFSGFIKSTNYGGRGAGAGDVHQWLIGVGHAGACDSHLNKDGF